MSRRLRCHQIAFPSRSPTLAENHCPDRDSPPRLMSQRRVYLQDEDKVVDGLVPLEEVVLGSVLALGVELELQHDAGMFDEPQQDLLRQVTRPERFHLCKG